MAIPATSGHNPPPDVVLYISLCLYCSLLKKSRCCHTANSYSIQNIPYVKSFKNAQKTHPSQTNTCQPASHPRTLPPARCHPLAAAAHAQHHRQESSINPPTPTTDHSPPYPSSKPSLTGIFHHATSSSPTARKLPTPPPRQKLPTTLSTHPATHPQPKIPIPPSLSQSTCAYMAHYQKILAAAIPRILNLSRISSM